jgi:DNA-directed RNA polymerase subunit RPC12/RpoP
MKTGKITPQDHYNFIYDHWDNILNGTSIEKDTLYDKQSCPYCVYQPNTIIYNEDTGLVCSICGYVVMLKTIDDNFESLDYDKQQEMFIMPKNYYKRWVHFDEILNQLQGSENKVIPEHIEQAVVNQVALERIDPNDITEQTILTILKKLKLNSYYESSYYFINKIIGRQLIVISPELKQEIKIMFSKTEAAIAYYQSLGHPLFTKNCPYYLFILYKYFELLDQHSYIKYLKKIKTREKMILLDKKWKLICEHLKWNYIPSQI